jgi:hypothetical protein
LEKPLPHALEAERSTLGGILLDDRAFKVVNEKLQEDDYFIPQHKVLYREFVQIDRRGSPIDITTVIESLRADEGLEAAGGEKYISGLADGLPRITNVGFYADLVKQKSVLRSVIFSAAALHARALDPGAVPSDLSPLVRSISAAIEPPVTAESALQIPDMPLEVLDGRLGEIYQGRLSALPLSYGWISLVTVAGTLVPPTTGVRTNLFGCLVGGKDTGKSQAIARAVSTVGLRKPQLENTLAGSFEGLAEKLDVNGDARLLSPDELGHLLLKAQIDGASFPYVLNSAYYSSEFDLTAARGKKIHVNCSLGIIGGIVDDNFSSLFGSATTAGLYDRFILGRCPSPFEYRYRPFEGPPENTAPCEVTIAPDVWELRDEWLKTINGLTPRCAEHAIRVAVIAASYSGRTILSAKHIEISARAFAEYQVRVRQVFRPNPGENPDAKCAFAILAALDEFSGRVSKRAIGRKIHADRFGPTVFERTIKALAYAGDIDVDEKQRPVTLRRIGN